jgi:hypothetical protein
MLTEPDMQARYVAAMLDVLTADLQAVDMPASRRCVAAIAAAAHEAHQLAGALAPQPRNAAARHEKPSRPTDDNVILFRRRA